MTPRLFPALILVAAFTGPAFAQTAPHQHDHPTTASSGADINVPAAAKDAVATVDRFSAALSSGDLAKAGKELDPNVLILESGGAERSAAEYLGGHARSATLRVCHPRPAAISPGWRAKASCTCRKTASR